MVSQQNKSFSPPYRGSESTYPTTRHLGQLLPRFMQQLGQTFQDRPDLIMAAWPEVIGSKLAPMTEAASFQQGILTVKVKNSTLYSLLSQNDKPRILKNLRDRFPHTQIKNIHFRLG